MSGFDIFAWIVLIILVASAIARVLHRRLAAGAYREDPRPSAGAGGNGRRLGHTDLRLCAVAGRADLGLCRRSGRAGDGAAAMMIAIMAVYLVLLFALVHFGVVAFNLFWKASPFIVLLLLNLGAVHPDGVGRAAGTGAGRAQRGRDRAQRRGRGDRRSGRRQYAAEGRRRAVPDRSRCPTRRRSKAIEAQLKLSDTAPVADDAVVRARFRPRPSTSSSGSPRWTSSRASSKARNGIWTRLSSSAPADGYVTNLALRKGARVANLPLTPVMAFIDTSEHDHRRRDRAERRALHRAGQAVEITFKFEPGADPCRQGRERPAGGRNRTGADLRRWRLRPRRSQSAPFVGSRQARRRGRCAKRLPAGATGTAAIYTEAVKPTHVIRKVLLRQIAILNYVNPF